MKPLPDPTLDAALAETRRRAHRRGHGRVFLTLVVDRALVTAYALDDDPMTPEDVQREMARLPRRKK